MTGVRTRGATGAARAIRAGASPVARDRDPLRRIVALAIVAAAVLPPSAIERGPVLCPVRRATGVPCPACGVTRSWSAALHGKPGASLRSHPLGLVALGLAGAYAAGLDERTDSGRRATIALRRAWPVLVAAWLGVWLARLARDA
jgi:hypothetical protein